MMTVGFTNMRILRKVSFGVIIIIDVYIQFHQFEVNV